MGRRDYRLSESYGQLAAPQDNERRWADLRRPEGDASELEHMSATIPDGLRLIGGASLVALMKALNTSNDA